MRPHHNWSDVLQLRLVHSLVLGEGYESPIIEVSRNRSWVVQEVENLCGDLLREAVGEVSWFKDGAVKSIWSKSLVEVGGLHCQLHILLGEQHLCYFSNSLKLFPQHEVLIRVGLVALTSVYLLEVLGDCLIYVVALADELVSLDHGSHHWIPALNLEDLFCSRVERLHISRSKVLLKCVKNLVVMEFPCELK